jgi:hypothetical protein
MYCADMHLKLLLCMALNPDRFTLAIWLNGQLTFARDITV